MRRGDRRLRRRAAACLVQKFMPPALQQTHPPSSTDSRAQNVGRRGRTLAADHAGGDLQAADGGAVGLRAHAGVHARGAERLRGAAAAARGAGAARRAAAARAAATRRAAAAGCRRCRSCHRRTIRRPRRRRSSSQTRRRPLRAQKPRPSAMTVHYAARSSSRSYTQRGRQARKDFSHRRRHLGGGELVGARGPDVDDRDRQRRARCARRTKRKPE